MSQSKLQVYTAEANPILEAYFNTLLGQEAKLSMGTATETTLDQITSDAATSFSIVGAPENADPFVVLLNPEWIPVISSAMVGREMTAFEEGVFDLAGQMISQSYDTLQAEHTACSNFPAFQAQPHAPGTWTPDEAMPAAFWQLSFELTVNEKALKGNLFLASSLVALLPDGTAAPAAQPAAPAEDIGVSNANFPDFGREQLNQDGPGNFDLLAEVELNVTVELGRRKIPLSEVLKLTTGSVIELEKLVGEPLEIFANGRLIAEGEAVVIEEQFGIRITNLASTKLRAKALA